ncbi:right-handed parallel beta-helix repeat-containing protein [Streptomyces sp. NPDC004658]|uniref:right-handed parallel beta-helix repeat-containing protein n=1 Tax=Streptomyces sp. NPDC004658 TaxID=3154672 RepID=UPI0033B5AF4A
MKKTFLSVATVMVVGAGAVATAGTAHAATVRTVSPGQSIQAAVDAAQPGDTVQLTAGTYQESVQVEKDNITIKGAGSGPNGTVIKPPAAFPANHCGQHQAAICFRGTVDGTDGPSSHATSFVHGGRVTGVRIDGFKVGISLSATDGTQADGNTVVNSGSYGVTDTVSKNSVISKNAISDVARAGVYIGNYNIPGSNTVVTDNAVTRSAYGISSYDSSGVEVNHNTVTGSCSGFFSFSDSQRVPGGELLHVADNAFTANNADCPGKYGFPESVQGAGVILVGTTRATVERNAVTDNTGPDRLSGGIVIVSSRVYDPADPTTQGDIAITSNALRRNGPDDIVWDGVGTGITFSQNACGTSSPAGLCSVS